MVRATFASLVLAVFLLTGCSMARFVTGTGSMQTKDFGLSGFTRVDAGNAFQVEITRADSYQVSVTISENLIEYLQVGVEGATLRLNLDPRYQYNLLGNPPKAKVTMPSLEGITLSGASRANVSGFESSKDLAVDLSGASQLEGAIAAGNVKMDASGASRVTLDGSGADAILSASGASQLNLASFSLNSATTNLSGASRASVNAKNKLAYDLSGASKLTYAGNPTIAKSQVSGASNATRK